MSSVGMTCCRSLRDRLVRHLRTLGRIDMAHLVRRRSCREKPVSLLLLAPSKIFSFSFELESDSFSLLRLLGSGDGDLAPGRPTTGTGSSLTKVSAVESSILVDEALGVSRSERCPAEGRLLTSIGTSERFA